MRKRIIFVMSHMAIGGSQKSLVNALKRLDYGKYEVTLYVRENKTTLLNEIPSSVRVCVNTNDNHRYYHCPDVLFWDLVGWISQRLKLHSLSVAAENKARGRIVKLKQKYEASHYSCLRETYDILISYLQGYTCKFAADTVDAARKICFYHNATDATPELHTRYLPQYDSVVTVSDECRKILSEAHPEIADRIRVIGNVMDCDAVRSGAMGEVEIPDDGRNILCTCGRLSREKGFDLVVEAAKCLKQDKIPFVWLCVGDGPMKEDIQRNIEKSGLEANVLLLGNKENPYPYIRRCGIYVQPSWEEAQSLTIMEAQVLQKPVVSTQTAGGRSRIKDGISGLLCDFSGRSIADKIEYLLRNKGARDSIQKNVGGIDFAGYNRDCELRWADLLETT